MYILCECCDRMISFPKFFDTFEEAELTMLNKLSELSHFSVEKIIDETGGHGVFDEGDATCGFFGLTAYYDTKDTAIDFSIFEYIRDNI